MVGTRFHAATQSPKPIDNGRPHRSAVIRGHSPEECPASGFPDSRCTTKVIGSVNPQLPQLTFAVLIGRNILPKSSSAGLYVQSPEAKLSIHVQNICVIKAS